MQAFTDYGVVETTDTGGRSYYASGFQLKRWATRQGFSWPISELARTKESGTVLATIDASGDLVELVGAADVPADELNAWMATLDELA